MFDEFLRNWCRRMHLDSWKSPLDLLAGWHPCLRKKEDAGLRPYGQLRRCGRSRFGLPARLIVNFFAICVANLKYGSLKSLSTKPRIWSRRRRRCWGPSTGTPFSICTYANLLLLQSNRMIFSSAVSFERKKKKIPDLSLPPCIPCNLHIICLHSST
jgi:hypothetical protein